MLPGSLPSPPSRSLMLALLILSWSVPSLRAGADATSFRAVLFDLGNTLVQRPRQWIQGAREALGLLREAGYRVGVISNTGTLTRAELLAEHLPPDFSFEDFPPELVTLSSEAGFEKPSLAIFALAAERAGLHPGEILFLDENLDQVLAAQRLGLLGLPVTVELDAEGRVARSNLLSLVERLVVLGR